MENDSEFLVIAAKAYKQLSVEEKNVRVVWVLLMGRRSVGILMGRRSVGILMGRRSVGILMGRGSVGILVGRRIIGLL